MYLIRPVNDGDRGWIRQWMLEERGAAEVISGGRVHLPENCCGFVAQGAEAPLGLVTYRLGKCDCEIVTLNVIRPGIGIGTALVKHVVEAAARHGCDRVCVLITNDDFIAFRFYQRQGFRPVAIHRDAVTEARKNLNPEIPLFGLDSIPIRDEIELELRWRSPGPGDSLLSR